MAEKEEKLWFFENEENIDVKIDKMERAGKLSRQKKSTKKASKHAEELYIPPEVDAKRN